MALWLTARVGVGWDLAVKVGEQVRTFVDFSGSRVLRTLCLETWGGKEKLVSLGFNRGETTVFL